MTPEQWERIHRIAEDIGWDAAVAKAFQFGERDGTYETREAVGRFLRTLSSDGMVSLATLIEEGGLRMNAIKDATMMLAAASRSEPSLRAVYLAHARVCLAEVRDEAARLEVLLEAQEREMLRVEGLENA